MSLVCWGLGRDEDQIEVQVSIVEGVSVEMEKNEMEVEMISNEYVVEIMDNEQEIEIEVEVDP